MNFFHTDLLKLTYNNVYFYWTNTCLVCYYIICGPFEVSHYDNNSNAVGIVIVSGSTLATQQVYNRICVYLSLIHNNLIYLP